MVLELISTKTYTMAELGRKPHATALPGTHTGSVNWFDPSIATTESPPRGAM
jgi:hypothetical protein